MDIIITWPHALGGMGGGTIGVLQIASHLREAGADVTVVCVASTGKADRRAFRSAHIPSDLVQRSAERVTELRSIGVDVVELAPSFVHYSLDGRGVRSAVSKIIDQRPIDAVLGWEQEYLFLPRLLRSRGIVSGMVAAGRYGSQVPRVGIKGRPKAHVDRHLREFVRGRMMRRVDVIFAISGFIGEVIVDEFGVDPDHICVANWGVGNVFVEVERQPCDRIERFLFFGSPDKRKGGFETVRAFAEVARNGSTDWTLKVVWQHAEEVEALAREHGIADRVIALHPMKQAELARELEWAQVAVLPSTYESFGLACAEAQVTGLPVIAYDAGGVAEVVTDRETGWLVGSGKSELLPDCIREAMRDPQKTQALGMAGRESVSKRFSWTHTAEVIMERITELKSRAR